MVLQLGQIPAQQARLIVVKAEKSPQFQAEVLQPKHGPQ
jgi:hypothetical protein